uniref:Uncharacterized protein n=1 Tax=Rhizophora mucronata TaxID=61149 RepID=A0A2P2P8M6_RHIMU
MFCAKLAELYLRFTFSGFIPEILPAQ